LRSHFQRADSSTVEMANCPMEREAEKPVFR